MRQPHQWSHEFLSSQTSGSTTFTLGKVSGEELGNHHILQSARVAKGPHPTCGQQEEATTTTAPHHTLARTQLSWHPYLFFLYTQFFLNWELVNYPNTLQRK